MDNQQFTQPLGETLEQAGLICSSQLEVALYDLQNYGGMRIGEILCSRGWVTETTVNFFAEQWQECLLANPKYPLGYYLQKAGLLNYQQTETILEEQPHSLIRFGSVAVLRGWISQKTLDFFLMNLFPIKAKEPSIMKRYTDAVTLVDYGFPHQKESMINKEFDSKQTLINEIDYEDIPWIG